MRWSGECQVAVQRWVAMPGPRMLFAMRVRVLFFGVLRDVVGAPERALEVAAGATAGEVLEICRAGAEGGVWRSLAVAVNQEYVGRDRVLGEGDEVALLPPVSGGCGGAESGWNLKAGERVEEVIRPGPRGTE